MGGGAGVKGLDFPKESLCGPRKGKEEQPHHFLSPPLGILSYIYPATVVSAAPFSSVNSSIFIISFKKCSLQIIKMIYKVDLSYIESPWQMEQ